MKTLSSSQPVTLKITVSILSLAVAAMFFSSCEKMDLTPDGINQDSAQEGVNYNNPADGKVAKTHPEPQVKHNRPMDVNLTAHVNEVLTGRTTPTTPSIKPTSSPEPYKVIGKAKASALSQQEISTKIEPDPEYKPNGYGGQVVKDPTRKNKVWPKD